MTKSKASQSMIGIRVEVPASLSDWIEGEVIAHDMNSGQIWVRSDGGVTFKGCESQTLFLD